MTPSTAAEDNAGAAKRKPPLLPLDRKLIVLIAVFGVLSAAFYGGLGWGAYRLIGHFLK